MKKKMVRNVAEGVFMSAETIQCATHGENPMAFVCSHLVGDPVGLGFHSAEADEEDEEESPSAWCDDCQLILAAHEGWNEESEKLIEIRVLCLRCFERARIQNSRPSITLDDLSGLKWKCGSCDEVHSGPALDFGFDHPYQWSNGFAEDDSHGILERLKRKRPASFLNSDYCVLKDESFFVRGILPLPIIGTAETFRWGVWGSLSQDNFNLMQRMDDDPKRVILKPMFSWLCSQISEYPDTLNLKLYGRLESLTGRPLFEIERTNHPLSREYYEGISPARVKEIMLARLSKTA